MAANPAAVASVKTSKLVNSNTNLTHKDRPLPILNWWPEAQLIFVWSRGPKVQLLLWSRWVLLHQIKFVKVNCPSAWGHRPSSSLNEGVRRIQKGEGGKNRYGCGSNKDRQAIWWPINNFQKASPSGHLLTPTPFYFTSRHTKVTSPTR